MIDFSTLQGLTIPEGVVTQIADASGRVLWELATGLPGTYYLRPSADISLEHPVVPDTLTAGYLAISEEVSDGTATYIGFIAVEGDGPEEATSTFRMSLNEALKIKKILSATLVADITSEGADSPNKAAAETQCKCTIYVDGEEVFSGEKNHTSQKVNPDDTYTQLVVTDTITNADMSNLVSALNSYISANGPGNFPEVLIEIYNYSGGDGTNPDDKSNYLAKSYVSQIAIALECE